MHGLDGTATGLALVNSEGWRQVGELSLALLLSALIGLEREIRQKSAGLRTHTLVGVGAALFLIISKYGFTDVLSRGLVVVDPSRVAAQVVTGVGFLGGGLIFVRRDSVRGLTTAAGVWVTAAVGAAAGAGLPIIAVFSTGMYAVIVLAFPPLVRRLPRSATAISLIRVRYVDGRGILRLILAHATGRGFSVAEVATESVGPPQSAFGGREAPEEEGKPLIELTLQIHGKGSIDQLAAELSEIDGVTAVSAGDANSVAE
ncbi:MAG: MgtC/SapB family protein [Acidimicrobiales bacterium]